MKLFHAGFVICGLFALSPDLFAQFTYSTNGNVITLVSYTGSGGNVTIPDFVTEIGVEAFSNPGTLTSVTIPSSVTTIDYEAFAGCGHLVSVTIYGSSITTIGDDAFVDDRLLSVYCTGNAPPNSPNGYNSFPVEFGATAYYLAGTSGWATFSANTAIQTVLWNPPVVANNGNPGTPGNPFGFTIIGSTNLPVLVEASTNLADGTWIPVQSCIVTNGSFYFTDPAWTNYPSRFYKVVLP